MPVQTQPKVIRCVRCGFADFEPRWAAAKHDCLHVKNERQLHCGWCDFACPADEWDAAGHNCQRAGQDAEAHRLATSLRNAGYTVTKQEAS